MPTVENKKKPSGDEMKIKIGKNGPYLISGEIALSELIIGIGPDGNPNEWRVGKKYPSQKNYSLCRCGQSERKPFCDGAHLKVGFDGTETASREPYLSQTQEFIGPSLKLLDAQALCASARFCHRAGEIWNLIPKSDDPDKKKIAIEEACDCPSGRLVVCEKIHGNMIEPELEKSIGLIEDPQIKTSGPIWVRGGIPVESADGKTYEVRNRVTLCRCGKSGNKPYCDSSHYPE